jgi:hypothetical protein
MSDEENRGITEGEHDDALLDELRALADRVDPVPDRVNEGARAAWTWRTIDAELIALTRDSAIEQQPEAALVRTTTGPRLLVFESKHISIELEVTSDPDQRLRLVGQLIPPMRAEIEVQHAAGALETESDQLGRFVIEGLSPGPARVRCRLPDGHGGRRVTTEWTQL